MTPGSGSTAIPGRRAFPLSRALCLTLAAWLAVIGCTAPEPGRLRVLAAASLTDAVETLTARYGVPVATSFGASSALARQIRDGAPADVFLSASLQWIDFLRGAGALSGEPILLARNRMVAVAPPGSALAAADPATLLQQLAPDAGVAIADEGVPAGEYARAALATLGLLEAFRARLVGQKDVRAVLHAVEQGELQAGFVYATDARVADVTVLFAFDPNTHPPIEYQAAALRNAGDPDAARAFLAYLEGDAARALLADAGFELP